MVCVYFILPSKLLFIYVNKEYDCSKILVMAIDFSEHEDDYSKDMKRKIDNGTIYQCLQVV